MTASMHYTEHDRFDSAMSLLLPPSHQLLSHTTNADSQRTAASPDDPHSAPWSRMNTRLGHDQAPAWHSERSAPTPAFDHLASHSPQSYRPHGLEESLATIESRLCLPTHDVITSTSCSSPSSPPLPQAWAAASSATAASTVSTKLHCDTPTICCEQCGVEFTGAYRRGNFARHARQKHMDAKGGPYTCTADGCYRFFARQDARIKHARKHHPGLYPQPVQRRQGLERETMASPWIKDGAAFTYSRPEQSTPKHESHSLLSPLGEPYTGLPTSLNAGRAQWPRPAPRLVAGTELAVSINDTNGGSTAASSLDFNIGQWLPASPQTSVGEGSIIHEARQMLQREVDSSIEVEELPRAARIVFGSLHAKLNPSTYSQLCDNAFRRWEGLLQQLLDKQSDTYTVYAKILEDLYAVIHAIDSGAIDTRDHERTEPSFVCRPHPRQESGSRGYGTLSLGLGANAVSPASRGSKPSARKTSQPNGSGNNVKFTLGNRSKKAESRKVDCPEYKHHLMHPSPHPPSCGGCGEVVMSQIRSHLNRVDHRDFYSGVKQCKRCKKDFVDRRVYDLHEAANDCRHRAQARRDIEIPWARLYLTRYPGATRVPVPYCDEYGWLPHSVLAQCRLPSVNSSASFLGQRRQGPSNRQGPVQPIAISVDGPSYDAGLDFLLQDVVAPMSLRSSNAHAADLARCVSGLSTIDPQVSTQGPASREVERYLTALHGASTEYLRMLAAAPRYLTEEQFRQTADEAQAVVHHIRNYQQRQSQRNQTPVPSYHTPALRQHPARYIDTSYATPVRNVPSPSASNEYYVAAGMSTQPSSEGFDTASSQYHTMQTGPSSVNDPANQTLLSPFASPNDHRRSSVSSHAAPDGPRRYRASSTTRSLRDEFAQAGNQANTAFSTIDPALLITPHSENGQEIDYLRHRFFRDR